jgi:hypothetical protein
MDLALATTRDNPFPPPLEQKSSTALQQTQAHGLRPVQTDMLTQYINIVYDVAVLHVVQFEQKSAVIFNKQGPCGF